ncbi:ribonuclease J [Mycoplasmopsis hyopharyngis]|uniref:ribonuclease J n=1 Tax=Mycoplasmopsis hyopharyngis TaxID=29558 RepID=UPI0038731386
MEPTKIIGLGGIQEIGKSTLVVEHGNSIFIIDAGIKFADTATTGIKGIIPDYSFLASKFNNIEGLFITHGHEDHIGGIVYLVQQVPIKKIYAPRIAIQYLSLKFEELNIGHDIEMIEIQKADVHHFGESKVDFWTGQHSIPDAFGIRLTTPNGSIMCTGDFRFDYRPIGNLTDFGRLDQMGKEGLTVLFSDSTNAMRPYHSPSETDILIDIEKHMKDATRKTIITMFASNLIRIKAIIDLAVKLKKKVACFGRSMIQGIKIGRKLGYIDVPASTFVEKKQLDGIPDNQLVILTTGSQGEQLAALSRMSYGKHGTVNVQKGDMIIFSSSPIPGNRMFVELLINRLYKLGAIIKENGPDGYLHTSGHAYKWEHDKIFQLTKPKYFMPYHGEYRMSMVHGQTAIENGVLPENVIIPETGQVYLMSNNVITRTDEKVNYGPIYIDGNSVLNLNTSIIKERVSLSENGFVNLILTISKKNNAILGRPHLISRGSFYVKTSLKLVEEAKRVAHGAVLYHIKNNEEWNVVELKQLIVERLENLFYKEKRRRPIIVPTILFDDEEPEPSFADLKIKFKNAKKEQEVITNETVKEEVKKIKEEMFGTVEELNEDIHDLEDEI